MSNKYVVSQEFMEELKEWKEPIISWLNGKDVFRVKDRIWVVRSKERDEDYDYGYVSVGTHSIVINTYNLDFATKFNSKEEAQEWANAHQEVIEVKD